MKSHRLLTLIWLLAFTAFHLWLIASSRWPLSADEAHYWEWSRRLDWSYYSKGPMVAYLIALSTRLGGHTEFWVRLPAVLLSTGTAATAYLLARRIFQSERAGFLSVVLLSLMPLYAAGSLLMTIDAPFVFCWGLASLCLHRAVQHRGEMAWYGAGVALGLGVLSKYTMLMLVPCVLLWLVLSPKLRPWLGRRAPYEAAGLALLISSPVIVWNARHGWLSGRHVLIQAGAGGERTLGAALLGGPEFLGTQLGVISPLLFVLLLLATAWAWREGLRQRRDDLLLLACVSAPVFLFFQVWGFVTKVQANWAAHAYLTAAVAAAGWRERWVDWGERRRTTRRLNGLLLASILLPALLLPVALFPELLGLFGARVPAAVDLVSKRLRGWPELGQAVGEAMQRAPRAPFLVSDRYQIASELAFYVPGNPRVWNANLGRRMNQYDLWGDWDTLRGRDGLFVTYGSGDPPAELRLAFREASRLRVVSITHRGEPLRDFSIYWGRDFRGFPPRAFTGY
ncbi:MAG TPA: glycosyltransferase family 39 protein [Candidatus Methylomirabilis sp.]|nr:glycosyltransferase family 39 protein [Candidatus Methylomirabilis sp.]